MADTCLVCGVPGVSGEQFCRACGAKIGPPPVVATAGRPLPQPVTAPLPPVPQVGTSLVGPPPSSRRPGWLFPAIVIAILAVAAAVGAFVVLATGKAAKPNLSSEVTPSVSQVHVAAEQLRVAVNQLSDRTAYPALVLAAQRLGVAARQARTAVSVTDGNASEKAAFDAGLAAVARYAVALEREARGPTPSALVTARITRDDALRALTGARAASPEAAPAFAISLPGLGPIVRIENRVAAARAAASTRTRLQRTVHGPAREYVAKIDRLLTNSAETRADLGRLIADIQSGNTSVADAQARIAAVVNQRASLQNAVALIAPPSAFVHAADLLRSSIRFAIDDDLAIQSYVDAYAGGFDKPRADRAWATHLLATARASSAKRTFVLEYNAVRSRLGLGQLAVADRY